MTRLRFTHCLAALLTTFAGGCAGTQASPTSAEASPSVAPSPPPAPAPAPSALPAAAAPAVAAPAEPISKAPYGKVDGKDVELYTLRNKNGMVMKVTNYGVIITELWAPDRSGKLEDIVGGYESVDGYVKKTPYFGTTVGRVANRIKNAEFKLEGKTYKLAANNGPHNLHGGNKGWDKVIWTATPGASREDPSVAFSYLSKDGEEGFPGNVTAKVTYTLTRNNELKIDIEATTDKTTIVNPAHHTYWMLQGIGKGGIKDQLLTIYAQKYTPGPKPPKPDVAPVPDGTVKPVEGTPFDFRTPKAIGKDLAAVGGTPIGYDNFWVVDGDPKALRPVATVKDPRSGRVMTLQADQIGVQFYAGIFLDGSITGKGVTYNQYDALCLETHAWVNAINVPAWKDAVVLKPGQTYAQHMVHRFTTE
jgi:aldose 1-epimerase